MGPDLGIALSVAAQRLAAQLLAGEPARDPVSVAERLLAVQGQDARGVRLAIRARTTGLTVSDFDRALSSERTLLITWLNRGTLHLVRSEDYAWLHALTTPPLWAGNARRLAQEQVSPAAADRAVALIERCLVEEGPLTRFELRDRLQAAGIPTEGQALVHLLGLATLRGIAVRGPMIGRQHAYVRVEDWLGPQPEVDRDQALAEMARRYLAGHAPAGERDLAKWAGLPLRDVRAGLSAIAREVEELPGGLLRLRGAGARSGTRAAPKLLGAFDPLLLGWASREAVSADHEAALVSGGVFRPFALAGGRAVAVWRISGREVMIEPFEKLSGATARALTAEADDVVRYLEA